MIKKIMNYLFSLKKYFLLSVLLGIVSYSKSFAQVELFGLGGYMTYSSLTVDSGSVSFDDGINYGFGLDFGISEEYLVELNYTHNETSARLRRSNESDETLFNMNTHYFQLGAHYEFRHTNAQKAIPYALVTLGATLFDAKVVSLKDEWRFSVVLGGGAKIYLGKHIGLRLQSRIMMPFTFSGGGVWCGPGGCSLRVDNWTALIQFDLTAGIFIRLGK